MDRPLAEGEDYIYLNIYENVVMHRHLIHRYRFYYDSHEKDDNI